MAPHEYSREELDKLSILDPEIDAIVKSGRLPDLKPDISGGFEAPLAFYRSLDARWSTVPPIPEVNEANLKYKTRDGVDLDLFVFSATESKTGLKPLVIFFHGGGGVMGSAYSVASLARDLVRDHDCVVVSPQYRLAPENPFPTGVDDAWDAFKHVANNSGTVHKDIDLTKGLIVGGASQGAVLTSLIALRAKETSFPHQITGLYFAAGAFIATPDSIPERYRSQYLSRTDERCLSSPILNRETKALFDAAYNPDMTSPKYRTFNTQPLAEKHAGIAQRVYFQVCGADINRDDSLIYAQVLREEVQGVDVKVDVFEGAPHVFWGVFAGTKLVARWKEENREGVKWLLGMQGGEGDGGKL